MELRSCAIETPMGVLPVWKTVQHPDPERVVVLVVQGALSQPGDLSRLPEILSAEAEVAFAGLPVRDRAALGLPTMLRLATLLGEGAHRAFRRRRVVLLGLYDAGAVAAMSRAPEIVGVVAVEPPVDRRGLAARADDLRPLLEAEDAELAAYAAEVFGAAGGEFAERDPLGPFRNQRRPTDVVVGELTRADAAAHPRPSTVGAAVREALTQLSRVELHVAPGAGHDVHRANGPFVVGRLRAAVRRAATTHLAPAAIARHLARAAPRTARRLLYRGPETSAFSETYSLLNPAGAIATQPEAAPFDVVLLQEPDESALDEGVGLVDAEGLLIASAPLGGRGDQIEAALAGRGYAVVASDPVLAPPAGALVRARKGRAPAVLQIDFAAYSRPLMEIRTRLPADALRAEPSVQLNYVIPPVVLTADAPTPRRLIVFQRPESIPPQTAWDIRARAILSGAVTVYEMDDHPELVSRIRRGEGRRDEDWEMYRVAHGIQTTNEELVEVFRRYNPEVVAFPNAVFELRPFQAGPRPPRVFYGGVTRGPFVVEVARALAPAIEAFPDTEFFVLGDEAFFEALPTARKTYFDYAPYGRYLELLASCSVCLSPLAHREMIETKSDAKYLDAAQCGAMLIASPVVYERVVRSGENGLIARELADWGGTLAKALGDQSARERMARTAWEEVRLGRMFGDQIPARLDWYESLFARREELNREALRRRPQIADLMRKYQLVGQALSDGEVYRTS